MYDEVNQHMQCEYCLVQHKLLKHIPSISQLESLLALE